MKSPFWKRAVGTCSCGGDYKPSGALPYSTLRQLGEQTDSVCGEQLYVLAEETGPPALVCPKCDLLPRERL